VSLGLRMLGRTTAEDIHNPRTGDLMYPANTYVDEDIMVEIDESGLQATRVRSALTCETRTGICATCYGRDLARGTKVNMGEAVGVIAAQSIGEPGTQLTMRTFHIGGTASVSDKSVIESSNEGKVTYIDGNVVENAAGQFVVMGRNMQVAIVNGDGKELEAHKVSYGTRLSVKDGVKVARGDRLAEWDPYATPIVTEVGGTVRLLDIVEGVSAKEETDEETGISSKVIVDWRSTAKGSEIQPLAVIEDEKGEPVKLGSGNVAKYMLAVGAILSVQDRKMMRLLRILTVRSNLHATIKTSVKS